MTWLKAFDLIKRYFPIILILLLLVQFHFIRQERSKVLDFKQLADVKQQELETWKDAAGKNRARAEIAEIDARNAKLVLNDELKSLIKKELHFSQCNSLKISVVPHGLEPWTP